MRKLILGLIAVSALHGCANEKEDNSTDSLPLYKREREFLFLATHSDDTGKPADLDTLIFVTSSAIFFEEAGQTYSSWSSKGKWGPSGTGITENDTSVWIHPPRNGVYKKLELSPFPVVKYPLEIGNQWTWKLLVGNHYSIPGHAEWGEKPELFTSNYHITGKEPLSTKLGNIECYVIESSTESKFHQTELKAFYSTSYGFVRLEYYNIDKKRLVLELVKERVVAPDLKKLFLGAERNKKKNSL